MFRENKWFPASVKILKNCANSRAQPQNAKHLGCVCVYLYLKRQVERKTRNYDNISF